MSHTADELTYLLGPRAEYLPSVGDGPLLREWAQLHGHHPFDVQKMSMVELTNIYHEPQPQPTAAPVDINETIVKILEAVNAPGFEVSLTRRVARAEMQTEILKGDVMRGMVKEIIEDMTPRRIELVTPQGVTQLEGLQHYMTDTIIRIMWLNHPVMMVGPAGCGKTTIAERAAQALNLPFYITSTINDTHELTGFVDGYGKYHSTPFRKAFEHGGVWVADEIDAWDAAALLAANSALANGYTTFPDAEEPIRRNQNFRMVATANTFGNGADRVYIGRNELDAASVDRFAVIEIDYDLNLERVFSNGNTQWLEHVWNIRKKITDKRIRHVASSRAIAMGAQALSAGLLWNDVENIYLLKGMSAADREKIK